MKLVLEMSLSLQLIADLVILEGKTKTIRLSNLNLNSNQAFDMS